MARFSQVLFQFPGNSILDPKRCKYNNLLWSSRSNGMVFSRQVLFFFSISDIMFPSEYW